MLRARPSDNRLSPPATRIDDRVEITLANGRKIAVGVAIDPMALARLVQVLDRV